MEWKYICCVLQWNNRPKVVLETFVLLLSPFAPHIAEELWHRLGHSQTLAYEAWPKVSKPFHHFDYMQFEYIVVFCLQVDHNHQMDMASKQR